MSEKVTIKIEPNACLQIWRDGEWIILYVEDGSGSKTTISLGAIAALDAGALLRGHGISAAVASAEPRGDH